MAGSRAGGAFVALSLSHRENTMFMRVGEVITCYAKKADGTVYRTWQTEIEEIRDDRIVTYSAVGGKSIDVQRGTRVMTRLMRAYYWFSKHFNFLEEYEPNGELNQLYANVASQPLVSEGELSYIDYELDVMWRPCQPIQVLDEDEFEAAIHKYGYTTEHQAKCRDAVTEIAALMESWQIAGAERRKM